MSLIEFKNVNFIYNGEDTESLSGINLKINEGDFVVVSGKTGSGKSTLLRLMVESVPNYGTVNNEILFDESIKAKKGKLPKVMYLMQQIEHQIITDKVWHELAFCLEQAGLSQNEMRNRVAEVSNFFGIEHLYKKSTDKLSGGEKQLLVLASLVAANPKVLVLDEPVSKLDPITAEHFTDNLRRLHDELGITVVVAEHRLESLIMPADKLVIMDKGKILLEGKKENVCKEMALNKEKYDIQAFPPVYKKAVSLGIKDKLPLSVKEAKDINLDKILLDSLNKKQDEFLNKDKDKEKPDYILSLREVCASYDKKTPVISNLSFKLAQGKRLFILGGNGSGKSTLLKVIAGVKNPDSGKIKASVPVYMLIQDVEMCFLKNTVKEELLSVYKSLDDVMISLDFSDNYLKRHPYDLSGGEKQLLALAKVLSCAKKDENFLLLLDEPTKGLDEAQREKVEAVLSQIKAAGNSIITVTHDLEYASKYADYAAFLFDKDLVGLSNASEFFKNNKIYTTQLGRLTNGEIL